MSYLQLKILEHSYIYRELDDNLIADNEWMTLADELIRLRETFPHEWNKTVYYDYFDDFDGSTDPVLGKENYPSEIAVKAKMLVEQGYDVVKF